MIKKSLWLGQLLVITSTLVLLAGCGKKSNDAQIPEVDNIEFPSYVEKKYRSEKIGCVDLNLNGFCDSGEEVGANKTTSPLIKNYDDLFLTAVANSEIITPFTTLINNEVMYNPLVKGDVTLAKAYLTAKLNLNFSNLDLVDGPEKEANQIIESLVKANQLVSSNPYFKIAAAVDLMVYAGSFSVEPQQIHLDKLKHPQLRVRDSFVLNTTGRVKVSKFDLHPVTGRMIILADDNTRIALNANTGAYSVIKTDISAPITTSTPKYGAVQPKPNYSAALPQRDDDHDDDKKDHHDDDDDDNDTNWYDEYLKWLEGKKGTKFIDVSIVKQSLVANKFYLLTANDGVMSAAGTCESSGSQGLFLMAMSQDILDVSKTQLSMARVSAQPNLVKIDAFSSATKTDLDIFTPKPGDQPDSKLPDPIPDIDNSEASCYSPALKLMAITDDSDVIAVVANGINHQSIHRLSGQSLRELPSASYALPAGVIVGDIVISNDGQYIAFTDLNNGVLSLVNFNTMTLVAKYVYPSYQLTKLSFISDHQLVVIGKGSNDAGLDNQVLLIDYAASGLTLAQNIALKHSIDKLTVNQNAQLMAVANNQDISVLKLTNHQLSLQNSYIDVDLAINQIGLLSDKVIFSANAVIHYITFEGIFGSELRAAQRYLTKSVIMRSHRIDQNANLDLPRTFAIFGLNSVKIEWRTNHSEQIDVTTGRLSSSATTGLTVTATISGLFRGEIHRIEKSYQII